MIECKIDHGNGKVNIGGTQYEVAPGNAMLIRVVYNCFASGNPAFRVYATVVLQNTEADETNVIFKLDSDLDAEIRANEGNHMPGTSME